MEFSSWIKIYYYDHNIIVVNADLLDSCRFDSKDRGFVSLSDRGSYDLSKMGHPFDHMSDDSSFTYDTDK